MCFNDFKKHPVPEWARIEEVWKTNWTEWDFFELRKGSGILIFASYRNYSLCNMITSGGKYSNFPWISFESHWNAGNEK